MQLCSPVVVLCSLDRYTSDRGLTLTSQKKAPVEPYTPPALYSIRQGTVKGIHGFSAFVRLDGEDKDALVHVTQLKAWRGGLSL